MLNRRKDELDLYKLFSNDPAFKASWQQSMERLVGQGNVVENLLSPSGARM